jgi:cell division protein ZipA
MDADILRLILIILGGVLILAIYLWERHKRNDTQAQAIRHGQQQRVEPTLGRGDDTSQVPTPAAESDNERGLEAALRELGDLVSEDRKPQPTASKRMKKRDKNAQNQESTEILQQDLFADNAVVDADRDRQVEAEIPSMILHINVVAKDDGFEGLDIMRAVQGLELAAGDMQIFHRRDGKGPNGPVVFSMASMVEPGIFPLESMETFKTPGLSLFAQIPGPKDGLVVFSEMLSMAETLATELDGEMQDDTHSRLTKQTIEHLRSQILEHRRKVQLAKSKLR